MGQLKIYSSDLTDAQCQRIEPSLPVDKLIDRGRQADLREVLNAIFYRVNHGVK